MISYDRISHKSFNGYLFIWISQFISLFGSNIVSFAVIWYLTVQTESSLILSLASIASIVPMILVSPLAGVISDRANKNLILIVTDFTQAAATFALIILFHFNLAQLWHIIALLAIRGSCQGFQNPVSVAVTSLMVPEEKIKNINSFNQILMSLLNIASPAIGVVAISHFSIEQIYWLDVFTFIPAAIVLMLIRIPSVHKFAQKEESQDNGTQNDSKSGFKQDFQEGLHYIKESGLSSIFTMFGIANFIVVPIFSLFPLLILEYHGGGAPEYSWVEILFQVGLIIGALLLMLSKKKGSMKSVIISGIILSVILLVLALVPRGWFLLFYIICFIMGVNLAYIDTQLISVLQTTIPKELQGRVFATMFTIIKALNPIGLIIWGIIGESIPVLLIFFIAPGLSLVVYFILLKFTNMMHYGEKYGNNEQVAENVMLGDSMEPAFGKNEESEIEPVVFP
ncbi:MAG: MFS transporter [Promethearchaeota archaeon]